jgi:hypothetical protein
MNPDKRSGPNICSWDARPLDPTLKGGWDIGTRADKREAAIAAQAPYLALTKWVQNPNTRRCVVRYVASYNG